MAVAVAPGAVFAALIIAAGAGWAQGLVLNGDAAAPAGEGCMRVVAGEAVSEGCEVALSAALQARQAAGMNARVANGSFPPPSLGLYNQAATRQHLGTSFGHSVIPQAAPAARYTNPLLPPH